MPAPNRFLLPAKVDYTSSSDPNVSGITHGARKRSKAENLFFVT